MVRGAIRCGGQERGLDGSGVCASPVVLHMEKSGGHNVEDSMAIWVRNGSEADRRILTSEVSLCPWDLRKCPLLITSKI